MNEERSQRALELFAEAVELPPAAREAWLRERCAGDAELLREVLELLIHDERAPTDFIVPPSGPAFPAPPAIGMRLGPFLLLGELGRGAMGVVYRARQETLDRDVALKVQSSGLLTTDADRARFHREARAVARLSHPGIVRILVDGHEGQHHWFAMELVDGHDLKREIALQRAGETALPDPEHRPLLPTRADGRYVAAVAELAARVADALAHAHAAGVVHRDVKPSNLLLDRRGAPHLVDFGIARDDAQGTLTRSDQIMGSLPYMSPEQARVVTARVDQRTDVYSLGVVLYELLTLERPYQGATSRELIAKLLTHHPRPVCSRNPAVPRDLGTICDKAMAKEVDDRYRGAQELADDLQRFLRFEAIRARPLGAWERAWRRLRRRPGAAVGAVAAVAAVALGAVWSARVERARALERELAPLRALAARDDWEGVPDDALVAARRALRAGIPGAPADLVARLDQRFDELLTAWRTEGIERVQDGLRRVAQGLDDGGGYAHVVEGVGRLQRLAVLAPDDRAALDPQVLAPRVRLRVAGGTGGRGGWCRLDPLTGAAGPFHEVGPLPLTGAVFPVGHVRVVALVDGFPPLERTRVLEVGAELALDVRLDDRMLGTQGMVRIPGGTLRVEERTLSPLVGTTTEVAPFWIDEAEVSIADYRRYLAAHPEVEPPWYFDRIPPGSELEQRPVVYVEWDEARDYAEWVGKRLPSHVEWTLAARGPELRRTPWEGGLPYRGALLGERLDEGAARDAQWAAFVAGTVPVRSFPDAATPEPARLFHMLGNVAEWTESHFAARLGDGRRPDLMRRVVCGGAWWYGTDGLDLSHVQHWGRGPNFESMARGFRCARSEFP